MGRQAPVSWERLEVSRSSVGWPQLKGRGAPFGGGLLWQSEAREDDFGNQGKFEGMARVLFPAGGSGLSR